MDAQDLKKHAIGFVAGAALTAGSFIFAKDTQPTSGPAEHPQGYQTPQEREQAELARDKALGHPIAPSSLQGGIRPLPAPVPPSSLGK